MASSQLSPKKYIETRARTLPVYKCLVNKNWKEANEANVIVMRRHVNGNITAGIYLVDLLCLGVKDAFYFFNEPEAEIYNRFPADIEEMYDEIDYNLAHNIIYAAHDFALEFGIEPNKDFAVTKFILEEDNDNIPLLEIQVGDEYGLPYLIVQHPGEWSSALAKLQKNAGEGKYRYTISSFTDDAFNYDEENTEGNAITDYEPGRLTPLAATFISDEELNDFSKTEARSDNEKMTLLTEQSLRRLRKTQSSYFAGDIEETEDYELIDDSESIACGVSEEEEDLFIETFEQKLIEVDEEAGETRDRWLHDMLNKYADKLLLVAVAFEIAYNANSSIINLAKSRLEDLTTYPLAKFDLALANLLEPAPDRGFEDIYNATDIKKLLPGSELPGDKDIAAFWLIQTMINLKKNELKSAIFYYRLYSETNTINFMIPAVQVALIEAIDNTLKK